MDQVTQTQALVINPEKLSVLRSRVILGLFALALSILAQSSVATAAVCKVQSKVSGVVVGKGSTFQEALEDARVKCFERAESSIPASGPDRETVGLAIINECGNFDKCEG